MVPTVRRAASVSYTHLLGTVLCEQGFEPDEMKEPLCNNCNLCVEICPVNALEKWEIKQQSCWEFAFGDNEEEKVWEISCHKRCV